MMNAKPEFSSIESTTAAWIKLFADQLDEVTQTWFKPDQTGQAERDSQLNLNKNFNASMEATLKSWKAITEAIAEPEAMEALFKSSGTMPDILARLAQSTFSGYIQHMQNWLEQGERLGQSASTYSFNDIDENFFKTWTDIYEKEFQHFFQIPQVGLVRTYQERAYRAMDKYNIFQSTFAEFMRLLSLPIGKSFVMLQQKIGEMFESGQLPDDSKKYYQTWIKILEGHFMKLFQSPEYIQTLAKTLASLSEFSAAKDAVFEDLLKVLPIPNRSEIDELEKDIFELKKRMRLLEKQRNLRVQN